MVREVFAHRILENSFRGYWCEYMIAEALGPTVRAVGLGWNAWDLQIGDDKSEFPDRIRIQVKNSAARQSWHTQSSPISKSVFHLSYRKRPFYFEDQNPGVHCEEIGFMCELFVLCFHDGEDIDSVDQREPGEWKFYLLPVIGPNAAVTEEELAWASKKVASNGRPSSCDRRPGTLELGIRGRPPINPVGIECLDISLVRNVLGLN